jgi:DNA/RNA endonuclease YhcR with UshA esterase domain
LRRLIVLLILVSGLTASGTAARAHPTAGAWTQTHSVSCAGAVSWRNARSVIGRTATIRGRVAGTKYAASSNGSPTFLNLGVDYPSSRRVTVVIWGRNRARFGAPESRYRGRTICVRGYVDTYRGTPEIEARSPSQIRIVG